MPKHTPAKVILHNLEVPSYSPHGLVENKEEYGFLESLQDVNRTLRDRFKGDSQVYIFDYDSFWDYA